MTLALSREDARAIEWDCAQLLTRFFNYFDQWRYDDMAALFAPDGVWHRAGKSLKRGDIVETLNTRSRTQTVRHVVTNTQVDVVDASNAKFVLYVTAYMHDTGTKATRPPKIQSPYLLLVVSGTLVKVGNDWKIANMSMNREFEF
ncbi:MAG: nuclear transport factor 2 family protein [Rhizomicrobium sp.]